MFNNTINVVFEKPGTIFEITITFNFKTSPGRRLRGTETYLREWPPSFEVGALS